MKRIKPFEAVVLGTPAVACLALWMWQQDKKHLAPERERRRALAEKQQQEERSSEHKGSDQLK